MRIALSCCVGFLLGIATAAGAAGGAFEPIAVAPARADLPAEHIMRGANLAAIGNCSSCHSAPDAPPYAGGAAVRTPFGTLYGSNVTPDVATGIGAWSEAAFVRAMREGMSRDGRHLYPAFPYDHFRLGTDEDLRALYAFFMTRDPVRSEVPAPALRFPFNLRPLLGVWKSLFLERGTYQPDAARDASWNRGAYLSEGLAHCGACHTPRNALGAREPGRAFAGGEADGWYAPPLDATSPSPVPWTVELLTRYLRTGITPSHAMAGGPMREVVANLSRADPQDVRAIAVYVMSQMGPATPERLARAHASQLRASAPLAATVPVAHGDPQMQLGATVYASACASCHDLGRRVGSASGLRMPLAVALYDADPRSFLRIVRDGIEPLAGDAARWMPAYGGSLTDAQLTALAAYLRRHAAELPPWPGVERAVAASRQHAR